jgi:hypothetical protein
MTSRGYIDLSVITGAGARENVKTELSNLKRIVRRLKKKDGSRCYVQRVGKPLSLEFKPCSYCG